LPNYLDSPFFEEHSLHLHVPAGATPKDGPSAGITMALSLMSLALNKKISDKLAMTGELTTSGYVLPIGGVKEKLIAAKQFNKKDIIFPNDNQSDYAELPDYLKKGINAHFVKRFEEVLELGLKIK
jgi:ATP-dependent Lon protease